MARKILQVNGDNIEWTTEKTTTDKAESTTFEPTSLPVVESDDNISTLTIYVFLAILLLFGIIIMVVVIMLKRRARNSQRNKCSTPATTTNNENDLSEDDSRQKARETQDATQTNVDWFKIFKDIIPMLPIEESAWKFFAFELFHICQERCGLPKDIHNEVKKIEHSNKDIALAYHEVFYTWYRLLASHVELDHIEKSLQRFENGFIMQEFELIKSNPPMKQQYPRQVNTTVTLWERPATYKQNTPRLVNCVQQEHLYETEATQQYELHHMREQFIQFKNVSDTVPPLEISETVPNRLSIPHIKDRHPKDRGSFHKLKDSYPKRNSKVWQKKRKAKTNLKTAVKLRHLMEENDNLKTKNIILLKKILPSRMIPVSRQEYNLFLDHTVHLIMEHNSVTKRTVLSLTFKAYTEIAETKNGARFVLHCDDENIKLDKEQYESLDFYVRHARTRVLEELSELGEYSDTSFLFITYDGKPALQTYQRKQSVLRKTTNASRRVYATHTFPYDGGDFSPFPTRNETGNIELHNTNTNETVTNGTISTGKQTRSTISTETQNLGTIYPGRQNQSTISTGKPNLDTISSGKLISSSTQNYSEAEISQFGHCVDDNQKDAYQDVAMEAMEIRLPDIDFFKVENETATHSKKLLDTSEYLEISECLRNKHENEHQHKLGTGKTLNMNSKLNVPLEDFLKEIDKELEGSTYI